MSAQKLDGSLAMMISADSAAFFALGCDSSEAPSPRDTSRSFRVWAARFLNFKKMRLFTPAQIRRNHYDR